MLPEYTPEELEQNAINNMKALDIDKMLNQGMDAEKIADSFMSAKLKGHKTLRNPPERTLEPWRINEIGIR